MTDGKNYVTDEAPPLAGENLVRRRLERGGKAPDNWSDWGQTWDQDPNWDREIYDRESTL
jgi:hypothetical protein